MFGYPPVIIQPIPFLVPAYMKQDLRGQQKTGNLGKKQSMLSDAWHLVTQRNSTLSGKGLSDKGNGLFQFPFIKKRHCWNGRYFSNSVYPLEIYPRQQVSLMLIMSFPFVAQCKLLTPIILTQHFQNYCRPTNFFNEECRVHKKFYHTRI